MAEVSEYVLEPIREGAEFTLHRARQPGNPMPLLAVAPAPEQPLPQSLRRLEHEYSLAAELIPRGRPSLWRSRVMKDGQSWFSPTPAVSLSTRFLTGTGSSRSIWPDFYESRLAWQRRSAMSASAV
jgi:hypothetical protein